MKPKEFSIPRELLTEFKEEVRFFPLHYHPAGYIMFDMAMLAKILRSGDTKAQKGLANNIEKLGAAGGNLVIMG